MTREELERVYDELADGIDAAGPERSEVFLARVCLSLAHAIGDTARVLKLIDEAATPED